MPYLVWWTEDIELHAYAGRLTLPAVLDNGVYVISEEGHWGNRTALYVGSGDIRERVEEHLDGWLASYADPKRHLRVSWAWTLPSEKEGIERYLADVYRPLYGLRHPHAEPIKVNLPWQSKEDWFAELSRAF